MKTLKSRTFCVSLLLLLCLVAFAVPAKRTWVTFKQSDGTSITVSLTGDEHLHYYITQDNVPLVRAENGDFHYATHLGEGMSVSGVIAHEKEMRNMAEERQVALSCHVADNTLTPAEMKVRKAAAMGLRRLNAQKTSLNDGTKKRGLVILTSFSDLDFRGDDPQGTWNNILNQQGYAENNAPGSVADYFRDQSNGLFDIEFDVIGPVKMPKEHTYYGKNDRNGNDMYVGELLVEACFAIDEQVNFQDYDWDGDGWADMVFLLYAGCGENYTGNPTSLIWPHEWHLLGYEDYAEGVTLDNTMIGIYACSSELSGYEKSTHSQSLSGLGTFCHEFSHCMGLKDHYDINGRGYGTGFWDIMCFGCYNGNSFLPAEYNSYEKMFCGWKEPIVLNAEPQKIEGMKALAAGGDTYIFYNDGNENEYYMLENRQKTGWDAALPGEGLIVLHVDYSKGAWEDNQVNYNAARQRMTVIPADNTLGSTDEDKAGDAWPYQGNNSLTNYSRPACTVYNANTDGTGYMNKYLLNITQNADGTISFEYTTKSATKQDKPEGALLYETFDNCSGIGGNDGIWDGDNVGLADFFPDNDGWSGTPKTGANKCALLGNATRKANAVTPSFKISEPVVISFLAAPYTGSSDNKLILAANYGCDAVLDVTEFTLVPGQWTEVKANVTGSGDAAIRFKTNDKGVFIDNVCVIPVSLAGISSATADQSPKNGEIYSIDGRYMGKSVSDLRPGIYVMNGKKLVK